uniref:Uncharacterized protein n=1 Tax=Arundo donax TaxID=35708 RepID=A0A0A9DAH9_ARUDO
MQTKGPPTNLSFFQPPQLHLQPRPFNKSLYTNAAVGSSLSRHPIQDQKFKHPPLLLSFLGGSLRAVLYLVPTLFTDVAHIH